MFLRCVLTVFFKAAALPQSRFALLVYGEVLNLYQWIGVILAITEIYTLSLHDALPISPAAA